MSAHSTHTLRQRLRLYWVMDGSDLDTEAGRARVTDALQSGVGCVQLRDKHSSTRTFIARTRTLLRLAQPWHVLVIVNDRVDVALAAGAHGVHLGQSDTPLRQARALLGTNAIIGLSIEHLHQLHEPDALAADYLAISPVFDTPTKTNTAPAWGLQGLRQARQATQAPLVAIGGIDTARLPEVWATGVDGVAVVRAISTAADTGAASTHLRSLMAQARPWRVPRVLAIAGSDSGGCAGIQADLKTNTAPAWGLQGLRQARQATQAPLVAIGGIDTARLPEVWATGVDGVAVVRAISTAADTGAASTHLRSLMAQARPWRVPRVLAIAGSDSGGCAGIQADLKTCAALGCHGMSAVTALTVQNTVGVQAIHAAPPAFLAQQIESVLSDIGADALKIGMLHDEATVDVVAQAVREHPNLPTVLDPVMVATSGDALITPPTVQRLRQQLFAHCSLITPNLDELGLLAGRPIQDLNSALDAAHQLIDQGARAVLVKGGHLQGARLTDTLIDASGVRWQRSAPRLISHNLHGTGCSLSSAIAAHLAQGLSLVEAVEAAHIWVRAALLGALDLRLGAGHGPLNHFHHPLPLQLLNSSRA